MGRDPPDVNGEILPRLLGLGSEGEQNPQVLVERGFEDAFRGDALQLFRPEPAFPYPRFEILEFLPDPVAKALRLLEKISLDRVVDQDRSHEGPILAEE